MKEEDSSQQIINEAERKNNEAYEKLKNNKFKQQQVPSWRPKPTVASTTITFLVFGVIYLVGGIIVNWFSNDISEVKMDYTEACGNQEICNVQISIEQTMKRPVMISYQLEPFYQNHRKYVKSRSDAQLGGTDVPLSTLVNSGDCYPVTTNAEMNKIMSFDNKTHLDPNKPAVPCGLIAHSFFNDTFSLMDPNGFAIPINEKDIAWEADKKYKFKNLEGGEKIQWIDMTNEHFIVWMRPAALSSFRKLWGKINQDLEKGNYFVQVTNNYNTKALFNGNKTIVLSTVNLLGGKNTFLSISYLVVGSVCIVLAVVLWVGYIIHQRRHKNDNAGGLIQENTMQDNGSMLAQT